MIKADFHTHSEASPDGGITMNQYRSALDKSLIDVIAITDHNLIDFAVEAQQAIGKMIIVGEEISTQSGDLIGLFLTELVEPNQTLSETIEAIQSQNGIVYVPHPFEKIRKGISETDLAKNLEAIDIIETINGRAWVDNRSTRAKAWAAKNKLPSLASSDSHHAQDLGKTYSILTEMPTRDNLVKQLDTAELVFAPPSLAGITAPSINRWQKRKK